jgi:hypothetical protein
MTAAKGSPCTHPQGQRTVYDDGKVLCGKCHRIFVSRRARVEHGTKNGYDKHRRTAVGEWPWPAGQECGCVAANAAYEKALSPSARAKAARKVRETARNRAVRRLLKLYEQDFAKLYAEEYALLCEDEGAIARLEREVATLLRAGHVPGRRAESIEKELLTAVKGKWATPDEIRKWARICQLRHRIGELREQQGGQ